MDRLGNHGFYLPSACIFCYNSGEFISHIMIHFPYTLEIWCGISSKFGLCFIAPENMITLLEAWHTKALNKFGKRIWHLVPGFQLLYVGT